MKTTTVGLGDASPGTEPAVPAGGAPPSHPARPLVGRRVEGRDGYLGTVVDTRPPSVGADAPHRAGALLVRRPWTWRGGWRRPVRVVPLAWVRVAGPAGAAVLLDADRAMLERCPPLRPDAALAADVGDALAAGLDRQLPPRSLAGVRVTVDAGAVTLSGALPRASYQQAAQACARRVPGVLGVRDETVADDDLVTAVAQALLADPQTRVAHLLVSCRRGQVWLDGALPAGADVATAGALAAAVPGVRSVHNGATVRATRPARSPS
jgi:osmotically-inducible protein OsmY